MKTYQIEISVKLRDGGECYSPSYAINFQINEKLPTNVDAQMYLRSRLAEELKRNFSALVEPIDNKTEEVKANADPLTDDAMF